MDKTSWRDTKTILTIQTYRKTVAIHGFDFTIACISQRDRRTNRTAGSARPNRTRSYCNVVTWESFRRVDCAAY